MPLTVHALASGSSGNAILIQSGEGSLLIDAGVAGRTLAAWLASRRATPFHGILLTHEHDDHLRGADSISRRFQAPVVSTRGTLEAASARRELPRAAELEAGGETALGPFRVRSFPVPHDAADPVGYVVEADGVRIVCATDLGCPTAPVRHALRGAHLCILESNHDEEWLRLGPYPALMKARVAGDRGHLSNRCAAEMIVQRLEEDGPATFWLAHLSAVNNSPSLARRHAEATVAAATRVPAQIGVALRDRPSLVWTPGASAVQPRLF